MYCNWHTNTDASVFTLKETLLERSVQMTMTSYSFVNSAHKHLKSNASDTRNLIFTTV